MTDIKSSNRLPVLQNEARNAHTDSQRHTEAAAVRALAAGAALVEAKKLCQHGTWGEWLAGTGIPERSAQRYMRLHRSGLKTATVADLGLAESERVASFIEKAWPEAGRGRVISGGQADERFWAVTYRPDEAEFAFYGIVKFYGVKGDSIGVGGQSMATYKPVSPLGLAMGHLSEINGAPIKTSHDIAPDEVGEWFSTVGAKLVQGNYGTCLEATFQ